MGEVIVFLGPTGAGKSVQAKLLAEARGGVHFSTGELLRRDPVVAKSLVSGGLAPSDVVQRIVEAAVRGVAADTLVVLDGFPRTLEQARWLEGSLAGWSRRLERAVVIEVDEETTRARLALRGRRDDSEGAQDAKRARYEKITQPVVRYYRSHGQLAVVDGRGTIEEVAQEVKAALA